MSAVYNVEPYLEAFFESLVRQTLGFERNIQLILVDDGSTDGSTAVLDKWRARYPQNVQVIRKENGGQASARNVGLQHATGEWVTFIDPDDLVDTRYFEYVDAMVSRRSAQQVVLVACKLVIYRDAAPSHIHPLGRQFGDEDEVIHIDDHMRHVQLSAASAFFRLDLVRRHGLTFDQRVQPNFEDGHFIGRYLTQNPNGGLGRCSRAHYFYRKRDDGSSTIDRASSDRRRFDDVWVYGYIDLLRTSAMWSPSGRAPVWAQRAVLYDLVWTLKSTLNRPAACALLTEPQRDRFKALVREAMSYVDPFTVLEFNLAGAWTYHKVGILGMFMGLESPFQHVHVEEYDVPKKLLKVRYFYWGEPSKEKFLLGDRELFPAFAKVRRHVYMGETFVNERIVWLPLERPCGTFRVLLGQCEARIAREGSLHHTGLPQQKLPSGKPPRINPKRLPQPLRAEYRTATSGESGRRFAGAFLFMDRDVVADDNAEHLYRYVLRARPDLNAFFVLHRSSADWNRLESEGFHLLAYGSPEHRVALMNATHLISSHLDPYVTNYPSEPGWNQIRPPYFTFLQHGVTQADLSSWLNGKDIDCLVTASPAEHASIVADNGLYKFTEREVVMCGYPRHDALLARPEPRERVLLVCPTWRKYLVGRVINKESSARSTNLDFFSSEFAQRWRGLLHSERLRSVLQRHGYRLCFMPHPNLAPYLEGFDLSEEIEVVRYGCGQSVQEIFAAASAMVTDYSSVAFEMGYLRRPVLYYQFDRDVLFGGGHIGAEGYFDYKRDGFGPVCSHEDGLIDAITSTLATDCQPSSHYLERVDRTFPYRDGRCCERTLKAILALTEEGPHPRDQTCRLLTRSARAAMDAQHWERATELWEAMLASPRSEGVPRDAEHRLAECRRRGSGVAQSFVTAEMLRLQSLAVAYAPLSEPQRLRSHHDLVELFFALLNVVQPTLFVEVGAGRADFSLRAREGGFDGRIVAFEANPHYFELYAKNAKVRKAGVEYLHKAVTDQDGKIPFHIQTNSTGKSDPNIGDHSTIRRPDADTSYDEVFVDAVMLDTFFYTDELQRSVLWIDVEGETKQVLSGAFDFIKSVQLVVIEVEDCPRWEGQWAYPQVFEYLLDAGLVPIARDFECRGQFHLLFGTRDLVRTNGFSRAMQRFHAASELESSSTPSTTGSSE